MTVDRNSESANTDEETPASTGGGTPASRQVNWFETFRYASRIAAEHGVVLNHRALPVAGTLQWCGMADNDARKLLSLILGGVREALTNDARQEAIADAGREISTAAPWSRIAQQQLERARWEEAHPWARQYGKGDAA
ncbi:DUF2742 domain-containing protein [Mycolicibacterium litorale]|uniref:Uncharacterized protein n=1 Tax=Mycolicibacterium litorale TaxID=758802 RepID=A0AAD1MVN5_9MYCO|nr:DUF2742 domain-containing protein [Mycolicibacterium litorale]MCV7417788.1 DUF2742 domain-containing protein [Mycolicibacterium litorale]TDY06822.1 uncharacterized protein DUF2742 [Mycolicibacterium litorale]BBY19020.1 hypothetical protein MLIT_46120 [Mycolicibacterium litorale]